MRAASTVLDGWRGCRVERRCRTVGSVRRLIRAGGGGGGGEGSGAAPLLEDRYS